MAPPNPPPSSHQTTTAEARKRRKQRRHAQQQPQPPEESPSPAPSGGAGRSAPPPAISTSNSSLASANPVSVAPGVAPTAGQAVGRAGSESLVRAGSSRDGRPPLPVAGSVPGMPSKPAGKGYSGDFSSIGRQGCIEGTEGLAELLPGRPISPSPGNGGHLNSAIFLPDCAPLLFDPMPERDPTCNPVHEVPLETGEIWGKGPEHVWTDGNAIRATFSPPQMGSAKVLPGAAGSGQSAPSSTNAGPSTRPEAVFRPHSALDTCGDMAGRAGSAPVCASGSGVHLSSCRAAGLPARPADSAVSVPLREGGISHLGNLVGSSQALWQVNDEVLNVEGDGSARGSGRASSGRAKEPQIWADNVLYGPDFGQISDATVSAPMRGSQRCSGEVVAGNVGSSSSPEWGGEVPSTHYAGPLNVASPQGQTAAAVTGLSPPRWAT